MTCSLESTYLPRCFSPKGPYGYSSGVGALTSFSRAVKLSPSSRSAPARSSSRCSRVLAPMMGADYALGDVGGTVGKPSSEQFF